MENVIIIVLLGFLLFLWIVIGLILFAILTNFYMKYSFLCHKVHQRFEFVFLISLMGFFILIDFYFSYRKKKKVELNEKLQDPVFARKYKIKKLKGI